VYGARPIRRWLEKKVVTELSRMLIREEIDENTTVYVDAGPNGSGLVYRAENNEEIVHAETRVKSDILIQITNGPESDDTRPTKKMKTDDVLMLEYPEKKKNMFE
jgi:ATP-dependent Clp protease ATP-binding subunit ClpB